MSETEAATKTEEQKPAAAAAAPAEEAAAAAPPAKEMRAIVLTGFGGLKTVKVLKKSEPTAAEGELLIRVKACGLNFLDLMVRQGALDNLPKTPFIMGFECSGEVEAVGEGVTDFKVGDRVAALTEYKAWAELVTVPAKHAYILPASMSFDDAAAVLMNYVVAYALLFDIGNLREKQTVLMHSVGGGVGHAVAQLCKTVPDVTLIGTASKNKHESLTNLVTHLLDHSSDYVQEVNKISPDGVDLVLDCLCGEDCKKGYSLLKPLGRYVLYGTSCIVAGETKSFFSFAKSWWQVDKVSPIKLYEESKVISGFNLRHLLYQQGMHDYVKGVVSKVFSLYEQKKITPVVDSSWAFEDVTEAMQKMHDHKNVGKLTLNPSLEPKPKPQPEKVGTPDAHPRRFSLKSKGKDKESKDGKAPVPSGESTDTEKDAKEEQTPPANAS
ncbi:synaptic vesicle membrane protein VAT-1 homolog-like isoform X1 [Dermacentor silvarum]|uniref:synaptic vesicle membrane protein VAT-1 homolog-like isoform X1 n=1 Tax=Dermacentor silvarum TaxID=543639 RepID=UPI001897E697|nr:synaptic vesicle membrane protein VAT-1 homolog-like isoform X1 [Dermacentor silvarum]